VFKLPFRRGNPIGIGGLVEVVNGPAFSTSVGLVQYGAAASERVYRSAEASAGDRVIDRFKRYLSEFF
jgi:cell division protein FtsA